MRFHERLPSVRRDPATMCAGVAAAFAVLAVAAGACSDAARVDAPGNVVVDDTRDQPRPPANPDPPPADAAPPDDASPYPGDAPDGYAPLAACGGCACSPDAHYCFGGGTSRAVRGPLAATTDAALPACTVLAPAATDPGCYALPPACATKPTCECLLAALQPRLSCYLVCTPGDPMRVYCPSP